MKLLIIVVIIAALGFAQEKPSKETCTYLESGVRLCLDPEVVKSSGDPRIEGLRAIVLSLAARVMVLEAKLKPLEELQGKMPWLWYEGPYFTTTNDAVKAEPKETGIIITPRSGLMDNYRVVK